MRLGDADTSQLTERDDLSVESVHITLRRGAERGSHGDVAILTVGVADSKSQRGETVVGETVIDSLGAEGEAVQEVDELLRTLRGRGMKVLHLHNTAGETSVLLDLLAVVVELLKALLEVLQDLLLVGGLVADVHGTHVRNDIIRSTALDVDDAVVERVASLLHIHYRRQRHTLKSLAMTWRALALPRLISAPE